MLRSYNARPLVAGIVRSAQAQAVAKPSPTLSSQLRFLTTKRPSIPVAATFRSISPSFQHYATKSEPPFDKIDPNVERKNLEKAIKPDPEHVSSDSAVGSHIFEHAQKQKDKENDDADMLLGIRGDIATIKETFALNEVPKETLYLGAAGLLPYLGTSLSTVYLAYDINHAKATGEGVMFTPETARQLLDYLEPIQIGYGAVIISFLGAIHWGLEYAKYGGSHGYSRYAVGVVAPAVAWPTILLPVEYALITQFLAFNFLYFHDAKATVRGWCPPWYSTYRFVLTFIVGASIVASLIGRGQIAVQSHSLGGPADKMQALRDSQWENLEREERERRKALAAEEEDDEEEEEEEEESSDASEKSEDSDDTKDTDDSDAASKDEESSKEEDSKDSDKQESSSSNDGEVDTGKGPKDKIAAEESSAGKVDNDEAAQKEAKNMEAQNQKEGDAKDSATVSGAKVKGRGEIA